MDTDQNPVEQGWKIIVYTSELDNKLKRLTLSDPNIPPGEYLFPGHPEDHQDPSDTDGVQNPRTATNNEQTEIKTNQTIDIDNVRAVIPGGSIPDRRPFDESKPLPKKRGMPME